MGNGNDSSEIVDRYFAAIDEFDPQRAVECFSEDVFYSHPPFPGGIGDGLVLARTGGIGRDAPHLIRTAAVREKVDVFAVVTPLG